MSWLTRSKNFSRSISTTYPASTQRTYVDAIYELAKHFRRPPESLTDKDVRDYFFYLTQTRQLAVSTVRTRMFAIRFLFQETLNREWPVFKLLRSPREKKLPVVLSRDEVWRVLGLVRTRSLTSRRTFRGDTRASNSS